MVGAGEAELVLCTGFFDDEKEKPEDYRARFAPLIARKLTLLCVNPDIVVQRGEKLIYCAGALARLYQQMGWGSAAASSSRRRTCWWVT